MKLRNPIKDVISAIRDPERELSERVFLLMTLFSFVLLLIALIGDVVTKEELVEIHILVATVIYVPTVTIICLYKNKLGIAIGSIIVGLIFFILPVIFFFGGGPEGGGVIWFVFAFMYVGLVMKGRWRVAVIVILGLETIAFYLIAYYFPEYVVPHTRGMFFMDAATSIILVGVMGFAVTQFQGTLYKGENERARKETERAEELARSQTRFFSSMSHEIRTPINSILGLNELILRDRDATEEITKNATGISGAGKLLLSLINDILDFSKIEAGSMEIVPVEYSFAALISEVVNMIYLRAEEKGLAFKVSIDPQVPAVLYGDEIRIKQILINLLNNAVKYTNEGEVRLLIECDEIGDNRVIINIAVTDTGIGIKKEAMPYLFNVFKRVDEEKNRNIEGTGLGLSIVQRIVSLMDGQIKVDSIYGEGSTFFVSVPQIVSDPAPVGEINIKSAADVVRRDYESGFKAPDVKLLIVDDNEMNLKVEKALLVNTLMQIDTVRSAEEALNRTLTVKYDVIMMDHLMPGMDGIECLGAMRSQVGGLNRNTPVVVLTANAGSDIRELYVRSGFDGYLVKPATGEAMEDMLIRHISPEKLRIVKRSEQLRERSSTTAGYARKLPVIISTSSMCDLPEKLIRKQGIELLPFYIKTDEGVFRDGAEADTDELLRYLENGGNALSMPPDRSEYMEFFSGALRRAHHVIYIAITGSMSEDYVRASDAAEVFDNVTVINSECLSSAAGILVLIASRLAGQGVSVPDIIAELETVKKRMMCSFVIDTTDYLAAKKLVTPRVHMIAKALNLHPFIRFREDKSKIGGAWTGEKKRAYRKYIHKAFPVDVIPDSDVVFITYTGVSEDTLSWIRDEISKNEYFEHVVFIKASAAITTNCGPGSFGIMYFVKSNKSYNLGSLIPSEAQRIEIEAVSEENSATAEESAHELPDLYPDINENPFAQRQEISEVKWYEDIEGIDAEAALVNSGSEEALRSVMKIYYDSIGPKTDELDDYYNSGDWENYTIKVHALKSSSRLIGALALSEEAKRLEAAGKERDIEYIRENHDIFIEKYSKYSSYLEKVCGEESVDGAQDDAPSEEKVVADSYLMEVVYGALQAAADNMDIDGLEDALKELDNYELVGKDKEKIAAVRQCVTNYDYAGVLEVLEK